MFQHRRPWHSVAHRSHALATCLALSACSEMRVEPLATPSEPLAPYETAETAQEGGLHTDVSAPTAGSAPNADAGVYAADAGCVGSDEFTRAMAARKYGGRTIEQLLAAWFVDSVPSDVEDYYTRSDVDTLVSLLTQTSDEQARDKIIGYIGMLSDGSERDVLTVTSEFELVQARAPSMQRYYRLVNCASTLGTIVARKRSARARDFLLERFRTIEGDVAKAITYGLGESGDPDALFALRQAQADSAYAGMRVNIDGAIERNQEIASEGWRCFYRRVL